MTRDSPASLHASASSTTALMAWDGSGAAMMPSVRANVVAASKTATWWSHLLGWWKRTFRWDVVDGGDRVHHDGEVGQGHQLVDFPLPVALVLQVPFEIEILRGQDRWHERSSRHDLDGDPVRSRQLLERLALGQAHQILAGEGFVELERGMAMESSAVVVACANGNVEKNELLEQHVPHALECGSDVRHEAEVQGDETGAPLYVFGAGPAEELGVVVACGRIQVTYSGGPGLFDRLRQPLVLDFSDSPSMRATFESLVGEYRAGAAGSAAMMAALMNQCLISVFRRLSDQPDSQLPWLAALDDPSLARVLDDILARPERPHSVDTLAELAHMSRSVFARRFHECFACTPMDYVRDTRLRRAAQLLHRGELSVNDVATHVGFASRSHFSRAFQAHFGCSPSKFRVADEA